MFLRPALICSISILAFAVPDSLPARANDNRPVFALFDFHPFGRRLPSGERQGIFAESIAYIEKESGVDMEVRMLPISRTLKAMSEKSAQVTITASVSNLLDDTVSLGVIGCSRIIIQTSAASGIRTLEDLSNKDIGFVSGGFLDRLYSKKFDLNPVRARSSQSLVAMLGRGRLDGVFASDVVIDNYIYAESGMSFVGPNWQNKLGARVEVRKAPAHVRAVKNALNQSVLKRLRFAVQKGIKEGIFSAIYGKYGVQTRGKC